MRLRRLRRDPAPEGIIVSHTNAGINTGSRANPSTVAGEMRKAQRPRSLCLFLRGRAGRGWMSRSSLGLSGRTPRPAGWGPTCQSGGLDSSPILHH